MVKKISIIGAGGVGSTLAFDILNRIPPEELVLVDIAEDLAKGVVLDLEDSRGFLGFSTAISGGKEYSLIKNSDIVVITAGVARKEGMRRLDLLKINAGIAKDISHKIKKLSPSSIIIVITNPLDFITYIVVKETKFVREKVLGMGSSLDTSRLFNFLYKLKGIALKSLEGFVFGTHSKDMIISPKRITLKGKNLSKVLKKEEIENLKQRTQLRGAEIVGFLKEKSAHFAPALACCALIEAIVQDKNEIIPVSVLLNGEYGLKDICLGVPCVINRKGVDRIIEIKLTSQEKKELQKTEKLFKECMI